MCWWEERTSTAPKPPPDYGGEEQRGQRGEGEEGEDRAARREVPDFDLAGGADGREYTFIVAELVLPCACDLANHLAGIQVAQPEIRLCIFLAVPGESILEPLPRRAWLRRAEMTKHSKPTAWRIIGAPVFRNVAWLIR